MGSSGLPLILLGTVRRQYGFSFISLLLLAVALISSLAYILIASGPNVPGQLNVQKTSQLVAQTQFISQRIVKCATDYSEFNVDSSPAYTVGSLPVANLMCPPNSTNGLWNGVDGVFLPAPPTGFNAWQYVNDSVSGNIYITISSISPVNYATVISAAASKIGPAADTTTDTLTVFLKKPTP